VVLTSELPAPGSDGHAALRSAGPAAVADVIDVRSPAALARLARYATEGPGAAPAPGYWTERELRRG
jgi:hypothetical protein